MILYHSSLIVFSAAVATLLFISIRRAIAGPFNEILKATELLTLEGKGVEVLAAPWVPSKWRPAVAQMIDQKDLKRIVVRSGHPGRTTKTVQYLVKGSGSITVRYESLKGGTVQKTLALQ